jgi:hypothetical protein
MADIKPVVMVPDDNARSYADSSAPASEEKNGPAIHATDEMRRLATPWTVAVARARLLESCEIPEGVILDPACGSATQLAALCSVLNKPGLGVELSGAAAPLAAINLERCSIWAGGDWGESSRILWGDGTVAESILQTYHQNIEAALPIALLHIDPARPQDAQKHTLDEMQPRLDHLLSSWAPFLAKEPALILDLSPRLSDEQRMQVEQIVSSIWGDVNTTWQWMTQGRGRIDRLSLWVGPVAISKPNRLVRLSKTGDVTMLEGFQEHSIADQNNVEVGEHLTIVDPSLIASGLAESWKEIASMSNPRWDTVTGRRPTMTSSEPILSTYHELHVSDETYETIFSFVQITGEIVAQISALDFDCVSKITQTASELGISSLKIRCTIDPNVQPKLQSKLDREMRSLSEDNSASSGFIAEVNNSYVICKEYN